MNIVIEHENSFQKILGDGFNLFVGAGFSTLAKDKTGKNLPIGRQLKEELIQEFRKEQYAGLDLPKLAKILESTQREAFQSFLCKRFFVDKFDSKYNVLEQVNIKAIFSTNIDNLINRYYLMILVKLYYVYKHQRLIPARCYAVRPSLHAEGR